MPERRVIYIVPPGAVTRVGAKVPGNSSSVPLWLYWAKIARFQARLAREARESDEMIDYFSASLAGEERERPEGLGPVPWHEMLAALVVIAAAAHALDGFYGTIKPMVNPQPSDAKRARQIMEALKLGFRLGRETHRFATEIDWLFELRDKSVHHDEDFRELVPGRTTDETVVMGAPEVYAYSADSGERAADLTDDLLSACLASPKPATAQWAEMRRPAWEARHDPPGGEDVAGEAK